MNTTPPVVCTSAHMRDTNHELHSVFQKGNGFLVVCSDRRAEPVQAGGHVMAVRLPELRLYEGEFTQEEHDKISDVFGIFERAYERRYNLHASDVTERTKEHVATLLQTQKQIADAQTEHVALQRRHEEKQAELAQSLEATRAAAEVEQALLDLQLSEKRAAAQAEHAALDAALAQKRAEASQAGETADDAAQPIAAT